MATTHVGGSSARASSSLSSDRDAESSSHHAAQASSCSPSMHRPACPYRNEQFYDQECSRFFDCPGHTLERASDDDDDDDDDRGWRLPVDNGYGGGGGDDGGDDYMADESASPELIGVGAVDRRPVEVMDVDEQRGQQPAQEQIVLGTQAHPIVLASSSPTPPRPVRTTSAQPASSQTIRAPGAAIPSMSAQPPLPSLPSSPSVTGPQPARDGRPSGVVLPRWQPDAEVTYCPICQTQFSVFVRKHHCRKCGRVVCGSCSPHRITIPYQYIVQPPGMPRLPAQHALSSQSSGGAGHMDFSSLGGGERVRLCNPCVPDPNTAPPQAQGRYGQSHLRSQSGVGPSRGALNGESSRISAGNRWSPYTSAATPGPELSSRERAALMMEQRLVSMVPRRAQSSAQNQGQGFRLSRPVVLPPSTSSTRHRAATDIHGAAASANASASALNRRLPPLPRATPQIAEEDECPVCHRELPSRHLPNFEALREDHISSCITQHSAYGTPRDSSLAGSPAVGSGPSSGSQTAVAVAPPPAPRRTGMFPYVATEKDCIDSAECTICLEEFETGVAMARLECLCRFHKHCIDAWWERHPGRCPMHQHDGL